MWNFSYVPDDATWPFALYREEEQIIQELKSWAITVPCNRRLLPYSERRQGQRSPQRLNYQQNVTLTVRTSWNLPSSCLRTASLVWSSLPSLTIDSSWVFFREAKLQQLFLVKWDQSAVPAGLRLRLRLNNPSRGGRCLCRFGLRGNCWLVMRWSSLWMWEWV